METHAIVPPYDAHALAEQTTDAYSFHTYGAREWFWCALMLATRGYNQPEAIAILYSKIMRLAADNRTGRKATSKDFARFLDEPSVQQHLAENLDEYVLNVLGEDLVADEPVKTSSRASLRLVWSRPNA